MSQEQLDEFQKTYPRALRRELEGKWAFARLMGSLSQPGEGQVHSVGVLAHSYALSSHIHHVDYMGAVLPFEHDLRSEERREAIHLAHAKRLLSDVFSFLLIRLIVGYRFVQHDMQSIREADRQIQAMVKGFGDAYSEWMRVEFPDS